MTPLLNGSGPKPDGGGTWIRLCVVAMHPPRNLNEVRASSYSKISPHGCNGSSNKNGWVKALALLDAYVALNACPCREARPEALRPGQLFRGNRILAETRNYSSVITAVPSAKSRLPSVPIPATL